MVLLQQAILESGLAVCDFTFLIEKRSRPWAEQQKLNFVCYDDLWLMLRFCVFNHQQFAKIINAEQLYGLAAAVHPWFLKKGGRSFGFSTNRMARFFSLSKFYDPVGTHEVDEFKGLLEISGLPLKNLRHENLPLKNLPLKNLPVESPKLVHQRSGLIVCIAGSAFPSRSLTAMQYAKLASQYRQGNELVIIRGGPTDTVLAKAVAALVPQPSWVSQVSFSDFCQQAATSRLAIGMEGGGLHVAHFYGTPCVAVFTSISHRKWGPRSADSTILVSQTLPCQPCARFSIVAKCEINYNCKNTYSPLP